MATGRIGEGNTAIQPTIVDAKGDLIVATAADTVSRIAVGANDTVLTADSSTATGLKWAAAAGGGKVLQVVQGTTQTELDVTSTTYTDSGLSASITPSSTSSKVLIIVSQSTSVFRSSATQARGALALLRGSTDIFPRSVDSIQIEGASATVGVNGLQSFSYLDSPATTSSTTYKTQQKAGTSGPTIRTQPNGSISTILLLEIGA